MNELTIRVCRLKAARGLALPDYATPGAAGMDVRAALDEEMVFPPGEICLVPTGISVAIPAGYEMQIRPRSGLAVKYGITLINSPGTIDSDYRGEIKIPLINHGKKSFVLRRGDRVAQLVIAAVCTARLEEVSHLDDTERGDGGFGHTGI